MGIINLDPIDTVFGCSHTGTYISTAKTQVVVERTPESEYLYSCSFSIFISETARTEGKPAIGRVIVNVTSSAPIESEVYTILYDKLKQKYPNYQNSP